MDLNPAWANEAAKLLREMKEHGDRGPFSIYDWYANHRYTIDNILLMKEKEEWINQK